MLNWEQERRRNTPKEYPSDGLPPTGSRQDILRWAAQNGNKTGVTLGEKRAPRNRAFKPMNQAVQQLELYVKCMQANSFYDKSMQHRREIVICIRRLIAKINTDPYTSSPCARDLVTRARSLISNMNAY